MDFPKSVPNIGLVDGQFVDENVSTGTPGSLIPSAWGNAVTHEVINVIEARGLAPSESNLTQLVTAIRRLISGAIGDIGAATTTAFGLVRLATQAQVDAGADTAATVTSATLRVRLTDAISTAIGNIGAATTTAFGLIRLATQSQVDAGTDTAAAVTSATLRARLTDAISTAIGNIGAATTSAFGLIRLATQTQVDAGTDSAAAVTSSTLATRLSSAISTKADKATTPTTAQMNTGLANKLDLTGGSIGGSLYVEAAQSFSSPALSINTSLAGSSVSLLRLLCPNTGVLLSNQNGTSTLSFLTTAGGGATVSAADVLSAGSPCHTAVSFMKPIAGQWVSLTGGATLPAGGTWAYQLTNFNSTGTLIGSGAGLVAGGTQLGTSYSVGFAWRYQ